MGSSSAVEKTENELQREIDELHRQQRQISERLRDPRGLRRGGFSSAAAAAPRNFASNGARHRGFVRPADRNEAEDQPPAKRRLLSAVVKVEEDGEIIEDPARAEDVKKQQLAEEGNVDPAKGTLADGKPAMLRQSGWSRRDVNQRAVKRVVETPVIEPVPRVLPKNQDPSLVSRNKRMLGQLLGTLEKFRKEDMKLSGTEAFIQRSNALQRAEQKAREESERLRQQEREQIAEQRKKDLTLRARIAAKAEEKKLELLFIRWSEHHKKLSNFIRTKAEPPIYYLFKKPLEKDATLLDQQREQAFLEWKAARREELSEYQKQIGDQHLGYVEKELERWQNARKARRANNDANLQETMDKELDTHRLEHGPKTRKIPGGSNNEDEDDVEDINVGEDDLMDDVLVVDDNSRRVDEVAQPEPNDTSPLISQPEMGNNLGRGKKAKVMKINGETFKLKTPARASDVVKDYPGYVLLDSEAVKHFGIRAKPLEPQQELKAKKIYFLVELPKFPEEKDPRNTRRVQSGIHMSAKDRLECLMLSRRSVSDIPMVRSSSGQTSDGPNTVRVKVRLPKAQVQKLVEESKDEAEVAEKIIDLYMDNSGEANGEHDHNRHVQWQPELGSITESFKTTKKRVSFVPEEGEIRLAVASH